MTFPVTPDGQWYRFEGEVLMPVDPSTGVAIFQLRPKGGMLLNVAALEQGDPGQPANIDTDVNFTTLAYGDPTPSSASFTPVTPPTASTPGLWRLNLALHEGEKGDDGDTVLDPADFTGVAAGRFPAINAAGTGFELVPQKVGDRYIPATTNNSGIGDANTTVAIVPVPAHDFDWRPDVEAYQVINGNDVRVDLVARLNNETTGNVVARCRGIASSERLQLVSMPPAGAAEGYDKVLAGNAANIYIRTELQSGAGTYTALTTDLLCGVKVRPVD